MTATVFLVLHELFHILIRCRGSSCEKDEKVWEGFEKSGADCSSSFLYTGPFSSIAAKIGAFAAFVDWAPLVPSCKKKRWFLEQYLSCLWQRVCTKYYLFLTIQTLLKMTKILVILSLNFFGSMNGTHSSNFMDFHSVQTIFNQPKNSLSPTNLVKSPVLPSSQDIDPFFFLPKQNNIDNKAKEQEIQTIREGETPRETVNIKRLYFKVALLVTQPAVLSSKIDLSATNP